MPIRFPCSECRQRLSVATQKAGHDVKCPRCHAIVRVPTEPPATATTTELKDAAVEPPLPDAVFGAAPDAELVYVEASPAESAASASSTAVVLIPRRYIYYQGFLLGLVALVFFVFGMIVGSHSDSDGGIATRQPCSVTGTVLYDGGAQGELADEGACVMIVPQAIRPDQKAAAAGLRASDPAPIDGHVGVALLRSLGGDVARVNRQGHFQLRVTGPGRYYILVISRRARRAAGEPLEGRDLAQIGRYVVPAANLLESQRYTWQELRVRGDSTFRHTF